MISKIIRIIIGLLGAAFGTAVYITLVELLPGLFTNVNNYKYIIAIGAALAFGIIFYIISPWILSKVREGVKLLDKEISKYPQSDILLGTIGLIVGLVIAYLIVSGIGTFVNIPIITAIVGILVYLFMGYIGIRIALKSRDDLFNINKLSRLTTSLNKEKQSKKETIVKKIPPKVLDTSVIIDGRIADICKTGFIEGKLVIPRFVLNELQHIADSSDDLKRVRGRRGLDILNSIQKEMDMEVEIGSGSVASYLTLKDLRKGDLVQMVKDTNNTGEVSRVKIWFSNGNTVPYETTKRVWYSSQSETCFISDGWTFPYGVVKKQIKYGIMINNQTDPSLDSWDRVVTFTPTTPVYIIEDGNDKIIKASTSDLVEGEKVFSLIRNGKPEAFYIYR